MALHSWDPDCGKAIALDWSATAPSKFSPATFESAWRSFKPGRGVGLGSLFEIAKTPWLEPNP